MRWRDHLGIGVVIATQLLILLAIAARNVVARATGVEVTLWTTPVDPYDPLAGYYVTLAYEVEQPAESGDQLGSAGARWLTVAKAEPAWQRVGATVERPVPAPDQVSMRAMWNGWRLTIDGVSRLYIPEAQRERVAELLGAAKQRALVDLVVGADGAAAVLRLRVGGETFGQSR